MELIVDWLSHVDLKRIFKNRILMKFLYFRCMWQGKQCDVDVSFDTTLTDLDVCYTFNNNINDGSKWGGKSLTVTESGQEFCKINKLNGVSLISEKVVHR